MHESARSDFNCLIASEENAGVCIDVSITDGDVDKKMLHFVKDKDLLIMLAHKEGHLEHLFFDRSIDRIISKLPCSFMLVKKEPEPIK